MTVSEVRKIDIVFDSAPGPKGAQFIEVENDAGESIGFGEWVERADGYWALRIDDPDSLSDARAAALVEEVKRLRELLRRWRSIDDDGTWPDLSRDTDAALTTEAPQGRKG